MPRRPRVDGPGAVHHVFVRGIERRDLFLDEHDRRAYLDRLSQVLPEAGASALAWSMLANHLHLVVRTGCVPLARAMHRVGTSYAQRFNRRYGREGYVFQGRYGARRVGDDADLLPLIRYVHRNPIAAGTVVSIEALASHPWTGHAALMGRASAPAFQSITPVLEHFGDSPGDARARLQKWMRDPLDLPAPRAAEDELDALIAAVCAEIGASEQAVRAGRKTRLETLAREAIARRAATELGLVAGAVAGALGVSRQALWKRLAPRSASRPPPRGPDARASDEEVDAQARPLVDGVSRGGRGGRRG